MLPPLGLLEARHSHVRQVMATVGVTRLLVTALPNVRWLTGFDGSSAAALIGPRTVTLVTDQRYKDTAAGIGAHAAALVTPVLVAQTYDETIADLIAAESAPVGFEAASLSVARHRWYTAALVSRGWGSDGLMATVDVVELCRLTKDDWELGLLREAGQRLSAVAHGVLADLRPGHVERDVAKRIEAGLRRVGFSRPAFDTIVASGPRSALPHARASERAIGSGELIVLDFGGVYGGYCVDLTRTVAFGDPGPGPRAWHSAVLAAQAAAVAAVAPGRPVQDVDRAARDLLAAAGLGEAFSHGTGHGLGLEVHEAPRVGPRRDIAAGEPLSGTVRLPEHLQSGMVFTIEPGVYLSGQGGARIEDDVLVTASGAEVLTSVPTTLDLS